LQSSLTRVAAVVDRNAERAEMLVRKFGGDMKASTSLEAVLGEVDGVVVATPNNLHAAVAKIALERGVPVLVEKPVATTFADAQELAELAERHGTFVLVGYNSRHAPAALLFERLLRERFLGKLQHFHFEFGDGRRLGAVIGLQPGP
jgi:predicted dehydrogenase